MYPETVTESGLIQTDTLVGAKVANSFTLHQVLRYQSLGELQNHDAHDLLNMKGVLQAKIAEVQHMISSVNQFKSINQELKNDVRWYICVELEIDALLAAMFHCR
ncbi:hypothetical protein [Spirosoma aerolatum]|uniref:hypothetical protein n=1 Tax=Spirosoma aerolatum TaxID=1211326 RepID=UPI0009AE321C|nr:hypothetical protein [Spirosoma aerolatum]